MKYSDEFVIEKLGAEATELFEEFSSKFQDTTKADYLKFLFMFLDNTPDLTDIRLIKKYHAEKFITEIIADKYSESTQEKIYGCLHSFLNFLYKKGEIQFNPLHSVEKPDVSRVQSIENVLTFENANKIYHILPSLTQRDRAIVTFFLTSGCLLSEVTQLRWNNLHVESYVDAHGEVITDYFCSLGTGNRFRTIKLHPKAGEYIMDYRIRELGLKEEVDPTDDRYMFIGKKQPKLTDRTIRNIINNAIDKAGLEGYSAKDFRHTFAAFCLKLGASAEEVGNQLGWKSKYRASNYRYVLPQLDTGAIDAYSSSGKLEINKDLIKKDDLE